MVAYKHRQRAMSKKADKRPAACDLTAGRVRSDARADQGGGAFLQSTAPQPSLPCHHRAHCVALFDVTPRHLPPPQLGDHIQLASGRAGNPFLLKRERNAHIVALRHDPPTTMSRPGRGGAHRGSHDVVGRRRRCDRPVRAPTLERRQRRFLTLRIAVLSLAAGARLPRFLSLHPHPSPTTVCSTASFPCPRCARYAPTSISS